MPLLELDSEPVSLSRAEISRTGEETARDAWADRAGGAAPLDIYRRQAGAYACQSAEEEISRAKTIWDALTRTRRDMLLFPEAARYAYQRELRGKNSNGRALSQLARKVREARPESLLEDELCGGSGDGPASWQCRRELLEKLQSEKVIKPFSKRDYGKIWEQVEKAHTTLVLITAQLEQIGADLNRPGAALIAAASKAGSTGRLPGFLNGADHQMRRAFRGLSQELREWEKEQGMTAPDFSALYERIQLRQADRVEKVKEFTQANLRLVLSAMQKIKIPPGVEEAELIQRGNMALMRAVESFNPYRGFKFSTFAMNCIFREFFRLLGDPKRKREIQPPDDKLYEEQIDPRGDGILARASLNEQVSLLRRALKDLDERSYDILRRRFGLDGFVPLTLERVGALHHVGKERARQLEREAKERLRDELVKSPMSSR